MNMMINDDAALALAARRAALATQDAREREARLAAARQQEEDRFAGMDRVAATFGRLLRRQGAQPRSRPVALPRRRDERDGAGSHRRRDAA
jgi:hypothetical protein